MRTKFGPPKMPGPKEIVVDLESPEEAQRKNILHLIEIINRLWRIKTTAQHHGRDDQKEFSLILRNVSSALDMFNEMKFFIKDHTGEKVPADGSLSWKVISYQEEKGVEFETVIETLKPSILFDGQLVQPGEVIISTPVRDEPVKKAEDTQSNAGGQE